MHQVLARKFRPSRFENVVGQPHITQTLMNAIRAGRIAHAYLFSGARGVGKTTTARILAAALNCENGPTPTPCGTCVTCREIAAGTSLDVLEVDGASHTGVDKVRNLTESVKYNTVPGKYKVYIIDEVHMLSTAAFNALLKTLEEPPPRVIFIFATTESHKVLATIQSRCQHFIFSLIAPDVIRERLATLIDKEQITVEPDALETIARAAGGSVRDAETLLEKVITYCGSPVTQEGVLQALGLVSRNTILEMVEATERGDVGACFELLAGIVDGGRDLKRFVEDLMACFRNLLFLNIQSDLAGQLEIPPQDLETTLAAAGRFQELQLLFILDILCYLENAMRQSPAPRILVEVALVKCCRFASFTPLDQVLKKLNTVPGRSGGQIAPPPRRTAGAGTSQTRGSPAESPTLITVEGIRNRWPEFLRYLETRHALLARYLHDATLLHLKNEGLTVRFAEPLVFHARTLNQPENQRLLAKELSAFYQHHLSLHLEIDATEPLQDTAQETSSLKPFPEAVSRQFLKDALNLFGGEVMSIKSAKRT